MSNLMEITPSQQTEIQTTVGDSIDNLESLLQTMQPQEQAIYLRDSVRNLIPINIEISKAILYHLWKVMSGSLWTIPLAVGADPYNSFREWVDGEIRPYLPEEMTILDDCIRIIERTLPYAMANPVKDKEGMWITPKRLIQKIGFGKLKMTSSHFLNEEGVPSNERTAKRSQILVDLATKSATQIRREYSKPRIPPIKGSVNLTPRGTADVILLGLSANQMGLLRSCLGINLTEYQVHLREQDRWALTQLLPIDAQEQQEQEEENQVEEAI